MENVIIMYTSASHNVPSPTDSVILRKLGRFDHCFNAFWTCPVDKSLSQESSLNLLEETCRMTWNAHVHPPWQGWPGNLSWPTCELSPGPPGHMGSEEREPSIYRSQLHGPGTISLLPSDVLQNTKGQSLGLLTVWQVPSSPPSAALGGSPGERALAASAFSVISLNSWERARCQKCLQVNSSPLSSASDFTPVSLSVFIFCGEELSVRPVNLFQV